MSGLRMTGMTMMKRMEGIEMDGIEMDKGLLVIDDRSADEWITVSQLPVIEDKLAELHELLKEDIRIAKTLTPTLENKKEMKRILATWNKRLKALESLKRGIKKKIEEPLVEFENGEYRLLVKDIQDIVTYMSSGCKECDEQEELVRKKELFAYYEEYRQSLGLDSAIADPKKSGIKVGLSASMKSLKEQARQYLDRIDGDLKMIDTLDDADEVLAEYRQCMSVTDAVRIVSDRHKRIEDEKIRRMAEEENRKARETNEKAVEEAIQQAQEAEVKDEVPVTPTVKAAPEETGEVTEPILNTKYLGYEIFGTLTQLKALKAFLKEELKNYLEREGMKYGEC